MLQLPLLALDRSLRRIDADGHLHVEKSNISKATVNPYLGREIPGNDTLGLDAEKIYYLLRDPIEIEKAVGTFCNKPLLMHHVPISADQPSKDLWVGTIGSDVAFDGKYLTADLAVWDAAAIKAIESDEQSELSCGYRYTADMTPGTYEGKAYDGVMRNLVANHVALVREGRAGRDVHVHDEFPPELKNMRFAKLLAAMKPCLKPEADLVALDAALSEVADLELAAEGLTADEQVAAEAALRTELGLASDATMCDADKKKAYKAAKEKKIAGDKGGAGAAGNKNFEGAKDGVTPEQVKIATDEAVRVAVAEAVAKVNAAAAARKGVEPLVGVVALDSAEDIYKFALKHENIDTEGVHASAFPTMVALAIKARKAQAAGAPRMSFDSSAAGLSDIFGHAGRLNG